MKIARNIMKEIIFTTLFLTVLVSASLEARLKKPLRPIPKWLPSISILWPIETPRLQWHVAQRHRRFQLMPKSWSSDGVDTKLPSKARMVSSVL